MIWEMLTKQASKSNSEGREARRVVVAHQVGWSGTSLVGNSLDQRLQEPRETGPYSHLKSTFRREASKCRNLGVGA